MGALTDLVADLAGLTNKFLFVDAPSLDKDKLEKTLLLRSFSGYEGISQLFTFHLDLHSKDTNIDFDKIVGQNITIGLKLADGITQRVFNGIVSRFVQLPTEGRLAHYHAEMVPWLWFLGRTTNCRIFSNMTVPEIVLQVLQDIGFQDVEKRFQENYTKWEYCVQYRESALNFVMRLMEQEGIFFFFKHQKGKHTLVLADARTTLDKCPQQSSVAYKPYQGSGATQDEEAVRTWRREREFRSGKCAIKEFNYEKPENALLSVVKTKAQQAGNLKYELYDYPGEYERPDEGEAWVKLRMEEEELAQTAISAESNCRSFSAGFEFDLSAFEQFEPSRNDQNGSYLLTSVSHAAHETAFYSGDAQTQAGYTNVFTCIPSSVPFRPARVTPKPVIQGAQTAIVVGPQGEEIYTDKYGRVKVQFHWDRLGKRDEKSSSWIRVSHPWAGKGWGSVSIPRIGQEVIVDFLEGDPDRPIITGRVYNAEQMPPYALPSGADMMGFKSSSTKGGESYNEIVVKDSKGSELIRIHAQKDMDTSVGNNDSQQVAADRTIQVDGRHHEAVKGEIVVKSTDDQIYIEAKTQISLIVGQSSLYMDKSGNITLKGVHISVDGSALTEVHGGVTDVKGQPVKINC